MLEMHDVLMATLDCMPEAQREELFRRIDDERQQLSDLRAWVTHRR